MNVQLNFCSVVVNVGHSMRLENLFLVFYIIIIARKKSYKKKNRVVFKVLCFKGYVVVIEWEKSVGWVVVESDEFNRSLL